MNHESAVTIILPTYNRAGFLPEALKAIRAQTFLRWELIIVDDGSTDKTPEVIANLATDVSQPIRYVNQANLGPAAARNTGLTLAESPFVAFYDSDDLWLPHHLADCVSTLEANPDVHWVCTALRTVDQDNGAVLEPNTFYVAGRARPFLAQRVRSEGHLRIVEDKRFLRCMIEHGGVGNLQASVFRREVFDRLRLPPFRIGEDQVFMIHFLKEGFRFGYIDDVHVVYRLHGANISAASGRDPEKAVIAYRSLIAALESLIGDPRLSPTETRVLKRRISREYFWHLGYNLLCERGRPAEALEMFRNGLRLWPWDVCYWKTYIIAHLRLMVTPKCDNPGTSRIDDPQLSRSSASHVSDIRQ